MRSQVSGCVCRLARSAGRCPQEFAQSVQGTVDAMSLTTRRPVLLTVCVLFRSPTSYGPRADSRAAVDRLGANTKQRTRGVLIVPGARTRTTPPTHGCCSELYPPSIPYTGGYRAVMPGAVRTVTRTRRPGTDRLTLRSLGRWGREHGVTTVMIHERLDRFATSASASSRAEVRRLRQRANRRNYDTVVCTTGFARRIRPHRAANTVTVPRWVGRAFHPRRRCAQVRQHLGHPRRRSCWSLHGRAVGGKARDRSIDALLALCVTPACDARLVVIAGGPLRARLERKATRVCRSTTGFISDRHAVFGLLASAIRHWHLGYTRRISRTRIAGVWHRPCVHTSALTEIITADGACADNRPKAIAHAVRTIVSRPERHRRRCALPPRQKYSPGGRQPAC